MLTLGDSGSGTVRAGIGMCDPPNPLGTVTLPTTTQTDTGIAVAVNHSPTGNPNWAGTFPGGLPTGVANDYKTTTGGSGIDAGTTDNAPAADYFGTARPQGTAYDIGFYECAGGSRSDLSLRLGRPAAGRPTDDRHDRPAGVS